MDSVALEGTGREVRFDDKAVLGVRPASGALFERRKVAVPAKPAPPRLHAGLYGVLCCNESTARCHEWLHDPDVDPMADEVEETKLATRGVDLRGDLVPPWIA